MSNTEQVSLDEMIARHEPPAELQNEVEQALWNEAQNGKKRRTRRDKGVPKGPKPVAEPVRGAITEQQAGRLRYLMQRMDKARFDEHAATRVRMDVQTELDAFVDSLTVTN